MLLFILKSCSIIILIIILSSLFLLIVKFYVNLSAQYDDEVKNLNIRINIFRKIQLARIIYCIDRDNTILKILFLEFELGGEKEPLTEKNEKEKLKTIFEFIKTSSEDISNNINKLKKVLETIDDLQIIGDIYYGTGNPYSTGIIYGIYNSLCFVITEVQNIKVHPNYTELTLKGKGKLSCKLRIINVIRELI